MARRFAHCQRGMAAIEFVLIAPALLAVAFGIVVYSLYFSAVMGVRYAAGEGARAAVAGLGTTQRTSLATARAQAVIASYGSLLTAGGSVPVVTAGRESAGVFKVKVVFDMTNSPLMRYGAFLPLPSKVVTSEVFVTNGSY